MIRGFHDSIWSIPFCLCWASVVETLLNFNASCVYTNMSTTIGILFVASLVINKKNRRSTSIQWSSSLEVQEKIYLCCQFICTFILLFIHIFSTISWFCSLLAKSLYQIWKENLCTLKCFCAKGFKNPCFFFFFFSTVQNLIRPSLWKFQFVRIFCGYFILNTSNITYL